MFKLIMASYNNGGQYKDDDDYEGLTSLLALGIYDIDHYKERIGYKEIRVQKPIALSSNRPPWFFKRALCIAPIYVRLPLGFKLDVSQKCLVQAGYQTSDLRIDSKVFNHHSNAPTLKEGTSRSVDKKKID